MCIPGFGIDRSGAEPVSVATSIHFDSPRPTGPIHQALGDLEQSVRQCKFAIDLAASRAAERPVVQLLRLGSLV